ncbi:hypothetical protein Hanom_Chr09g00858111 [Helianthus anomalus]
MFRAPNSYAFYGFDDKYCKMVILYVLQATTKSKLASLNEKLDTLERRLELLEVQVSTATANPNLFKT